MNEGTVLTFYTCADLDFRPFEIERHHAHFRGFQN